MRRLLVLLALTMPPGHALAAPSVAEGERLVKEKGCDACHSRKVSGDAKAFYLRKDRKVTDWGKLKAMVAACNSELNLQLFPEDEEHIAEYLNQTYHKFKK